MNAGSWPFSSLRGISRLAAAIRPRAAPLLEQLMPMSFRARRAGAILDRMAMLPFADLTEIIGDATPLVLAPHPDDESLGCGGLIAEACAIGLPPAVVVLTDGAMSHPSSLSHPPSRLRVLRRAEARAAVAALGLRCERLHFLNLPDGRAPHDELGVKAAAHRVADLARAYKAGTIVTTWEHDPHADHVSAQTIARAAARLVGARVVSYPVWGWALPRRTLLPVGSVTGVRLDIARHLAAKRRAIAAHESQHSGLIADDPEGFHLPASLLSAVDRPFEVFLFEQ
ncbi:MAG: hypothetical protein AVDCRST_MAG31-2160 [uncultured Sphingomonas sp.]|uniref:LmbE-like protein n=1 Tax=uncultured Sphingomonas sp. TaxID=158754 RepID=A0A6J4TP60_9SPHN|nr:MAG: hypothetical protein AVDCRST_MAG31-2160 [uncultured Sphingomonas sp.]